MIYRFDIDTDIEFDAIRILKKRASIIRAASDEDFRVDVRSFNDPYHEEGDQYAYALLHDGDIVFQADFVEIDVLTSRVLRLQDLFHPLELKGVKIPPRALLAVVHQTTDANSWWTTSRSWVTEFSSEFGGSFLLNDKLLYPQGQNAFNYADMDFGNIFIMPVQVLQWMSYLSFQVEKPYYNYPETIPRAYSFYEMQLALEAAVNFYNGEQPRTRLKFAYSDNFQRASFPEEDKVVVIELAAIELLKANVINWIELQVSYSDGVDVEINKFDSYSSFLDGLRDRIVERITRAKTKYIGRGIFLGAKFGFSGPFGTGAASVVGQSDLALLKVLRDTPGNPLSGFSIHNN